MKTIRLTLAVLGLTWWLLRATPAWACSCVCAPAQRLSTAELTKSVTAALQTSELVFFGRVTQIDRDLPGSIPDLPPEYADDVVTLEVLREWKGTAQTVYTVTTSCCDASCGYPFKVGQYHLYFLDHERERIEYCCPDPAPSEVQRMIQVLDRLTHRPSFKPPSDLKKGVRPQVQPPNHGMNLTRSTPTTGATAVADHPRCSALTWVHEG